jgi:hypothetical protein
MRRILAVKEALFVSNGRGQYNNARMVEHRIPRIRLLINLGTFRTSIRVDCSLCRKIHPNTTELESIPRFVEISVYGKVVNIMMAPAAD